MQLPEVFQSWRFPESFERYSRSTFFCAVVHHGDQGMHRIHEHRQAGNVLPVMRYHIKVDPADEVPGTGELTFLVPCQIAEIGHAEFPEGDDHPDRLRVFTTEKGILRLILWLEVAAERIRGPGTRQWFARQCAG